MPSHSPTRTALVAIVLLPALGACGGSTGSASSRITSNTPTTLTATAPPIVSTSTPSSTGPTNPTSVSGRPTTSSVTSSGRSMSAPPVQAHDLNVQLNSGDTFTTGQAGVLCAAETNDVVCRFNTAQPDDATGKIVDQKICGELALQAIRLNRSTWQWVCGTGVPVIGSKATNAWASNYRLPINKKLQVVIIPAGWQFTAAEIPCGVSPSGALECSTPHAAGTGFTADSKHVRPRGARTRP